LLFFLQAFSPIRYDDILSEERLDRALSRIQKSRKDLIPESSGHIDGTNYSYVNYRSIRHVKIFRAELSDQGPDGLQTRFHYNYRLESFSLKEAKSYLTKSQIHNNLPSGEDDDNNGAVIRLGPFASGIYFTGEEMISATEEELGKAFNILRKNDLIQPTINWLSDDDNDENNKRSDDNNNNTRFIFTDGRLQELIYRIWVIQGFQLDILRDKINYLSEKPNAYEIQMLARLYGEKEADRIIHHVYSSFSRSRRKSSKHGKKKEGEEKKRRKL
jgi:hypothetical protein